MAEVTWGVVLDPAASGNLVDDAVAQARQAVAAGVRSAWPIAVLREFLTALRALLETGTADFHGELLTAAPPLSAAVPGADPTVGRRARRRSHRPRARRRDGPQALRATGELADGALPFLAGPRALGEHIVPTLTAAAERAGRPAPRVVAFVPAVVTSGAAAAADAAREAAAEQTAFYDRIPSYQRVIALEGVRRAAELVVVGDEERAAAEARRYPDAGATEIVFSQTGLAGEESRLRAWRLAGELAAGG
ncbi:hypothetical protein GCM10009801_29850 [Streptomyces albiaxialis]|uniref:Luciferase-like domain-containing protein n=1 Tax=Streptomyces albiaxialis TaxID=329523 RepID=A0ABN2VWN4_9ACTN